VPAKTICDFHFILVPRMPGINSAQFGDGVPHSGRVSTVIEVDMDFVNIGLESLFFHF